MGRRRHIDEPFGSQFALYRLTHPKEWSIAPLWVATLGVAGFRKPLLDL